MTYQKSARKLVPAIAFAGVLAGALLGPQKASATIIFTAGNHPSATEEEVLFAAPESGTTVSGVTNQSHVGVTFNTLSGQTLVQTAQGQADIFCGSNCVNGGSNNTSSQLNSIEVKLASGFGSTDFIGNLNFGEGWANIVVTDQMGAQFQFQLGNGQNFFTLNAIDNEVITDVQVTDAGISSPFGFNDFKQPRISGLCTLQGTTCAPIATPEPASIALLGSGLIGLGFVAYRRRRNEQG